MMRATAFATTVFLGAMASQMLGCMGLTAQQCSSSSECDTGFVCGASGVCVKPATAGTGGPVVVAAAGTGCTTTEACTAANGGRPSLCQTVNDPCVDLATDDCPLVSDGWDNPDAIFLGSISQSRTQNVDDTFWGDAHEAGFNLAISEVMASNGGIGGGTSSTKRPIVGIRCNLEAMKTDAERAADASRVIQHLVRDVKVASLSIQDEHNTVPAMPAINAQQIFTMCSFCSSTPVATTPTGGLLWRATSPFSEHVELWNSLLQNFETRVRANPAYGVPSGGAVRVALAAAPTDEYVAGMAEAVSNGIRWNGNQPLANNLSNFLRTTNDSWEKSTSSATVFSSAQQIVDFKPHVVLLTDDTEAIRMLVPLVESLWTSTQERPFYVLNNTHFHPHLPVLIGGDESLRKRMAGVVQIADPEAIANFAGFVTRVSSALPPGRTGDLAFAGAASGPYDATYSIIYAIAASGVVKPTGADLRTGLSRLVGPGPQINLNSSDFNSGLAVLAAGQNIDLMGSLSKLDWDMATHGLHQPISTFCVERDKATANVFISGSLSPTQIRPGGTIIGDIACF